MMADIFRKGYVKEKNTGTIEVISIDLGPKHQTLFGTIASYFAK